MKTIKKISTVGLILVILSTLHFCTGQQLVTNQEKAQSILTDVFNLNPEKFQFKFNGLMSFSYRFDSSLKEESIDYTLVSGNNSVKAAVHFVDGSFSYCTLRGLSTISERPKDDIVVQSSRILQSYQSFLTRCGKSDLLYISSMIRCLEAASNSKTNFLSLDNAKINISSTNVRYSNSQLTSVNYYYSQQGLDVERKAVTLQFLDGNIESLSDSWNLWSIGSWKTISRTEALNMAWDAANKLSINFTTGKDTTILVKPDLTNVQTKADFNMIPRNGGTELYPYWHIQYFFEKPLYQDIGIEVGIWGDTQEVGYCKSITTLGQSIPQTASTPQPTGLESFVPYVAVTVTVLVVAAIVIIWKTRKSRY